MAIPALPSLSDSIENDFPYFLEAIIYRAPIIAKLPAAVTAVATIFDLELNARKDALRMTIRAASSQLRRLLTSKDRWPGSMRPESTSNTSTGRIKDITGCQKNVMRGNSWTAKPRNVPIDGACPM
jgi:hypothetical protein